MTTPAEKRTRITDRLAAMSPEARQALMNFHGRQGAPLPRGLEPKVAVELRGWGMINARGNLTGLGQLVREEAIELALRRLEGRAQ